MPILIIPSDETFLEHGEPGDPDYPHKGGKGQKVSSKSTAGSQEGTSYARPKVIQVKDIDEALRLIANGQVVELPNTKAVNTLLHRLAAMSQDALSKGQDAPNYNLCNVSVAGTNLFCHERVRTAKHPKGIPRIRMPQFGGQPRPGSEADKLPKDAKGQVDGGPAFIEHLQSLGIKTKEGVLMPAAKLKASQRELIGDKIAGMMTAKRVNPKTGKVEGFDPHKGSIFVSRDGYVIDGHHRWAAVVGLDAEDNALGDITMRTVVVDAPISEILPLARAWTHRVGISSKSAKEGKKRKKAA